MGESGHVAGCCGKVPNRQANSGSMEHHYGHRHISGTWLYHYSGSSECSRRSQQASTLPNSKQCAATLQNEFISLVSLVSLRTPTCLTGVATYTRVKLRQTKQSKTKQNFHVFRRTEIAEAKVKFAHAYMINMLYLNTQNITSLSDVLGRVPLFKV